LNDPEQEPPGSLEELHAKMRVTADSLGDRFGRGFDGKHNQPFSLRFGDKDQAALGLFDFMGVRASVVSKGMYDGADGRQGVDAIVAEIEKHGTDDDKLCLNYILHEEAGSCKKQFGNGIMDCNGDGELLDDRRQFDNDQGLRFEDFVKHR
jgi:hypothetical protein